MIEVIDHGRPDPITFEGKFEEVVVDMSDIDNDLELNLTITEMRNMCFAKMVAQRELTQEQIGQLVYPPFHQTSVASIAKTLGVTVKNKRRGRLQQGWTEEEDVYLHENWQIETTHVLQEKFRRSVQSIKERARILGLPNRRHKQQV